MSTLGFDNYVEPLKVFLQKYREVSFFIPCHLICKCTANSFLDHSFERTANFNYVPRIKPNLFDFSLRKVTKPLQKKWLRWLQVMKPLVGSFMGGRICGQLGQRVFQYVQDYRVSTPQRNLAGFQVME